MWGSFGATFARVAQSVEQGIENPCVGGSIPSPGTLNRRTKSLILKINLEIIGLKKFFIKIFLSLFAFGAGLGVWAVFIEPDQIKFKEYKIYIKDWSPELSGYSIAFLTDLHAGSPHIDLKKIRQITEQTNALQPDLILLGGDYMIQGVKGGTPVPSDQIASALSELKARDGVFAVLGNHDHWENAPRMFKEFNAQGLTMLENAAQPIKIGEDGFWLAGISDYTENAHDIKKALSAVNDNRPVIAFTHTPDIFPEIPARIALTLAGHTHGGQVYVPFLGRPVIPSKYGQRYAIGLVKENNRQIFISSGIGTSIIPVRFLTPPEVSVLKIYPKADQPEK